MPVQRRQAIQLLACATASAATGTDGLQSLPLQSSPYATSQPEPAKVPAPLSASAQDAANREKVLGIGGFFFRAKHPRAIGLWYREHLGNDLTPTSIDDPLWHTEAGPTVFSSFSEQSHYFGDVAKMWMLNFRLATLDRLTQQLQTGGIEVQVDCQVYPNGRFARIHDPEGNSVELWQPMTAAIAKEGKHR